MVSDEKRRASILNEFSTVFTQESLKDVADPGQINDGEQMLDDVDVSARGILEKITALNPEKSPGNDHVYSVILKNMSGVVALPLSYIFQGSLEEEEIPRDLRLANVTRSFMRVAKKLPKITYQ